MVPALQARRVDLQGSLKGQGGHGGSAGGERTRLRSILVVAECALAVMLVIGATLLIKSFWRIQHVDAGFRAEGILKAEYQLPSSRYPVDFRRFPDLKEIHAFTHGVLQKAERLPGVEAAAVSGYHPLDPGFTNSFRIIGREAEGATQPEISVRRVTPGYFRTMSVPLLRGRLLSDADHTTAPPVLLINEARPAGSSPGRSRSASRSPSGARTGRLSESSATSASRGSRKRRRSPFTRRSIRRRRPTAPARSSCGPRAIRKALIASVRGVIREQDPALAVFGLEPFAETVSRSVAERRFTMLVLGLLASVALILAAIGVHGVLSYTVTAARARDRHSHGARRAALGRSAPGGRAGHGSRRSRARPLASAAAFVLTRSMGTLLFGVTPTDPVTFVLVPLGPGRSSRLSPATFRRAGRRASIPWRR